MNACHTHSTARVIAYPILDQHASLIRRVTPFSVLLLMIIVPPPLDEMLSVFFHQCVRNVTSMCLLGVSVLGWLYCGVFDSLL